MKTKKLVYLLLTSVVLTAFYSCATIPAGTTAVQPFDANKYLGKWYEIARIDFRFERNLNNTTAEYSLNDDGSIKVKNQGYHTINKEWRSAIGKAKFVGEKNVAKLKVSFFGPFYSGYNVIAIDEKYKYALVAGESFKYLWILAREKTVPDEIKNKYLKIAEDAGYNTADLLWVEHNN